VNDKGKSDKLRLFVAIELPPEAQQALYSLKYSLGKRLKRARWIEAENLHLTLQFLGYCPQEQVPDITYQIRKAVEDFEAFEFRLDTLGAFPSAKRPRVFWIAVSEGKEAIRQLQKRVEESLETLGFEAEKRDFHPHITMVRFKTPEDLREAISEVDAAAIYDKNIKAEGIVLFLSQLTPRGANYHPVEKFFLKRS
jgi:2'-5' RNA ligase